MTLMLSTSRQRPVWSLAALIILSAGVDHRALAPWIPWCNSTPKIPKIQEFTSEDGEATREFTHGDVANVAKRHRDFSESTKTWGLMCAQGCRWARSGKTQNARNSKFVGLGPSGPFLGPFCSPKSRSLRLLAQSHETLVDTFPILRRLVEQNKAATLVQIPGESLKGVWFPSPFTVTRWGSRVVNCGVSGLKKKP
jgi:hypothetical protein